MDVKLKIKNIKLLGLLVAFLILNFMSFTLIAPQVDAAATVCCDAAGERTSYATSLECGGACTAGACIEPGATCTPPTPAPTWACVEMGNDASGSCANSCIQVLQTACADIGRRWITGRNCGDTGERSCGSEIPDAPTTGTEAAAGTQCCVSGAGCQPPISDASGLRCLAGSPDSQPCAEIPTCATVERLQQPPAPSAGGGGGTTVTLDNPLGTTDFRIIVGNIIKALTGGAGMLALLMFIYGGFTWLTAAGNSEKIQKGRDILVWSTAGMVVMFSSYFIVRFLILGITRGIVAP